MKTCRQKEKLLVLSNFLFFRHVFRKPSAAVASESVYLRERVKVFIRREKKHVCASMLNRNCLTEVFWNLQQLISDTCIVELDCKYALVDLVIYTCRKWHVVAGTVVPIEWCFVFKSGSISYDFENQWQIWLKCMSI